MKHALALLSIVFVVSIAMGQSSKKVQWVYSSKKIADKTYEVHMTATITSPWHLYSQSLNSDNGIAATVFSFTSNPLLIVKGHPKEEGNMIRKKEEALDMVLNYYEKTVNFVQVVKLKSNIKTELAGKVEFTVCNDALCLPTSTVEFRVSVGG